MRNPSRRLNKLTLVAVLIALGVIGSYLVVIPVGVVRAFPVQHFLTIVTAVLAGPGAAIAMAAGTSVLRILLGTGSLLAIPGSLVGAALVAVTLKFTQNRLLLCLAELVGTGILAPFFCVPIAQLFMGSELAVMAILPSFFFSSLSGGILAYVALPLLQKRGRRSTQSVN